MDWGLSRKDWLVLESDLYSGRAHSRLTVPFLTPPFMRETDGSISPTGGSLLARWERRSSEKSETALQFYYDHTRRGETTLAAVSDTFDLDFQDRRNHSRHEFLWGLGLRVITDDIANSFTVSFNPNRRVERLWSSFVQDEFQIVEDRLSLTLGAKLEHNGYTGFEIQPNVRLWWAPERRQAAWAGVSRAVRTPARLDRDFRLNSSVFTGPGGLNVVSIFANPNLGSEDLLAYELGYRWQPARWLSLDLAGFYNRYRHLKAQEPGNAFFEQTPAPAHWVRPYSFSGRMSGSSHGVELASKWKMTERWKLAADYSWLRLQLSQSAGIRATDILRFEGGSPSHQLHLHSYLDLPGRFEFDTGLYLVDELPGLAVPHYVRTDARLGWRPTANLEIGLCAANLLENRHPEFSSVLEGSMRVFEVGRSVYAKLTWRFPPAGARPDRLDPRSSDAEQRDPSRHPSASAVRGPDR
jgi:iron complex outermembrane receptor protein